MASLGSLPEELLHKILAYTLRLPPDAFSGHEFTNFGAGRFDLSRAHLAATYPLPQSSALVAPADVLRVCRRWARIGTPLAFDAVVLPTPSHCRRFIMALRSHVIPPITKTKNTVAKNTGTRRGGRETAMDRVVRKGLGWHVRRLRLEASCETFLDGITPFTPRVHTLALSLDFTLPSGFHMCPYPSPMVLRALSRLQPTRLLLKREHYVRGRRAEDMILIIAKAVGVWKTLERVDLSNYFSMDQELTAALAASPSLKYISMYDCNVNYDLSECLRSSALRTITGTQAIKPTVTPAHPTNGIKAILCRGQDAKVIKERYSAMRVAGLIVHDSVEEPSLLGVPV